MEAAICARYGALYWVPMVVLTWKTLKKIRAIANDPAIIAFFKSTLVPDELFFQTLIRYAAPDAHVTNCPLTLYQFTDYGYPVVYYSDHIDNLTTQQMFFARKFSSNDHTIRDQLDLYWRGALSNTPVNDARVGIVGPEYETRRRTYRYGVPGAPLIGSLNNEPLKVNKLTFVMVGTSDCELNLLKDALAGIPGLVVHGQLFHPDRVELAGDDCDFAGYGRDDVIIRDIAPQRFLEDIIRASKDQPSVFLIRLHPGGELPDVLFKVSDLQLLFLEGDPVIAFLENQGSGPSASTHADDEVGDLGVDILNHADAFERDFHALKARVCDAVSDRLDRSIISLVLSGNGQDWCEALATHFGVDHLQAATLFDRLKRDISAKFPHTLTALPSGLRNALEDGRLEFKLKLPAGIDGPMD